VNAVNKSAAAVAKAQGAEHVACVKNAGKGALPGTAQACLTADGKGKVAKAKGKTLAGETKSCGAAPNFAYTSGATANTAAQQAELDLVGDIYGANLDAAVISCASNKAGCACQQKVSKSVEALAATQLAAFVSCKKTELKNGATSAAAIANCVNNAGTIGSIANDGKGKIAKAVTKLGATVQKSCIAASVTGAFPGDCAGPGDPTACLNRVSRCRVCQAVNDADGFFINCDNFDNGALDATCESGSGPTPTPTPTFTPPPTATPTFVPGAIIKGMLPRTSGFWTYGGTAGQPGGETLCAATYAGTHVCTFTELQSAETAGELVGASDNGGAVTAFWKIDNTAGTATDTKQCIDALGTPRWHYGTAHTTARGFYFNFNALMGDLGSESPPVSCPGTTASVGCCS
jgi:hypothetical protein